MTTVEQYITRRIDAKKANYTDNIVSANICDAVLSVIDFYLHELSDNIVSKDDCTTLTQIGDIELSCKSKSTLQPIYGFKDVRVPTGFTTTQYGDYSELARTGIEALSSIYKSSIEPNENIVCISSIYDIDTWKSTFNAVQSTFISEHSLSGSILTAADVVAMLYDLMDILSHVYNHKINVYFKKTMSSGTIAFYTCVCPYQDVGAWGKLVGSSQTYSVSVTSSKSWHLYVSPYSNHNNVVPILAVTADDNNGSNSLSRIYNKSYDANNDNSAQLIYCNEYNTDNKTFNVDSNDGSNGIATAFKVTSKTELSLRSLINVEQLFDINPGKQIKAERIIAAIAYIFEIWKKNIATLHEDLYTCHYNCHGNSIGFSETAEEYTNPLVHKITYNYNQLDNVPSEILRYEKPVDNPSEYTRDTTQTTEVPILLPIITGNQLSLMTQTGFKTRGADLKIRTCVRFKNVFRDESSRFCPTESENVEDWLHYPPKGAGNPTATYIYLSDLNTYDKFCISAINGSYPASYDYTCSNNLTSLQGRFGDLTVAYEFQYHPLVFLSLVWKIDPIANQLYTGKEIKPKITVRTIYGDIVDPINYTLASSPGYKASPRYSNNIHPTIAKVIIEQKDRASDKKYYHGKLIGEFTIVREQIPIDNTSLVTSTSLQDEYILDEKENKPNPTLTNISLSPPKTLNAGADYLLEYTNTNWCGEAVLSVTGIEVYYNTLIYSYKQMFDLNDVTISPNLIPDQYWTGSAITPALTVYHYDRKLVNSRDYKAVYENNTDIGKATIYIRPYNSYQKGEKSINFKIIGDISRHANIEAIDDQSYTGTYVTPSLTVKFNNTELIENTDYTVEFANNVMPGTANITVTGKGNYSKSKNKTFVINNPTLMLYCGRWGGSPPTYYFNVPKPDSSGKYKKADVLGRVTHYNPSDCSMTIQFEPEYENSSGVPLIGGINHFSGYNKSLFLQPINNPTQQTCAIGQKDGYISYSIYVANMQWTQYNSRLGELNPLVIAFKIEGGGYSGLTHAWTKLVTGEIADS